MVLELYVKMYDQMYTTVFLREIINSTPLVHVQKLTQKFSNQHPNFVEILSPYLLNSLWHNIGPGRRDVKPGAGNVSAP